MSGTIFLQKLEIWNCSAAPYSCFSQAKDGGEVSSAWARTEARSSLAVEVSVPSRPIFSTSANSCHHHLVFRFCSLFAADFNEAEDKNPKKRSGTLGSSREERRPVDYAVYFNNKDVSAPTLAALRAREYIWEKAARVGQTVVIKEDLLLSTAAPSRLSDFTRFHREKSKRTHDVITSFVLIGWHP